MRWPLLALLALFFSVTGLLFFLGEGSSWAGSSLVVWKSVLLGIGYLWVLGWTLPQRRSLVFLSSAAVLVFVPNVLPVVLPVLAALLAIFSLRWGGKGRTLRGFGALVVVLGIVRGVLDLVSPVGSFWIAVVGGGAMAGGFLVWAFLHLGLARRMAGIVSVSLIALAWLAALSRSLSPGVRFNLLMVVYLVAFIVAAGGIASLFTYLFLKTFERLDRSPLQSWLSFLPLTAPSYYIVSRLLQGTPWGAQSPSLAYAMALDIVVAASVLLLVLVRLGGGRWGRGHYTWMIAWKFLKSQRLVPTWKTRRMMAIRQSLPERVELRGHLVTLLVAVTLVLAAWLGGLLLNEWVMDSTILRFSRLGLTTVAGAFFAFRFFSNRGTTSWIDGLFALVIIGYIGFAVWNTGGGADTRVARLVGLSAAILAASLVGIQGLLRVVLRRRARSGRLPRDLDPTLAPRIENRIREGVSASMFVSVVGVAVGVWALIVVLSVMGGFSSDLRKRIITAKDHVMVKATGDSDSLDDPLGLCDRISQIPGVSGASAYVEGDVMMSSNLNVSSTVSVRGVDDTKVGLAFLEPTLEAGSLGLFDAPELLVSLPDTNLLPLGLVQTNTLGTPGEEENESKEEGGEVGFGLLAMPILEESDEPSDEMTAPVEELDDGEDWVDPVSGMPPMPDLGLDDGVEPDASPGSEASGAGQGVLPTIIIGRELARSLGVSVGSSVTVISPDGDIGPMGVQPKARSFRVAATFATGMYDYDLTLAYMHLPDAQRFLNLGNRIDHIDVRLADVDTAAEVAAKIPALVDSGSVEVLTWVEMNKSLFYALRLERIVMFVVLGFIILIASFNIVSSLIIMIRRRLSAISILKTMGATTGDVIGLFFLLGLAAGFFGMVSGVIMGLSTCGIIENLGVTLPVEYYIRELPVKVEGWQVAQVALAALSITALAALWPGRLASRVVVVEGLKDER